MHHACVISASLSLLSAVAAQTFTDCNPTKKTCPADQGLAQASYTVDFTKGSSEDWNITYGNLTYDGTNGAAYTIAKAGDAPTVQSNFYLFFGAVSVVMRAAPGTGIVSSAILESDDLDEIDWEWLGGRAGEVETNYFGKGNTSSYDRETYVRVAGADSQAAFHNYTLVWTAESTTWLIDGAPVRTLRSADALAGANYPQTPMRVRLGTWAGGDPRNPPGTIQWAGGETDYARGPFTAYIKSVSVTNYNPAASYTYGDLTGSHQSIVLGGAGSPGTVSAGSAAGEEPSAGPPPANASGPAGVSPPATGGASGPYGNGTGLARPSGAGSPPALNGTASPPPTSTSSSSSSGGPGGGLSSAATASSSSSSSSSSSASRSSATNAAVGPRRAGGSALLGVLGCALALI